MRSLIAQDFQLPPHERIIVKIIIMMIMMIACRANLLLGVRSEHAMDYESFR
jgi:hypothetical protein